MESSCDYGVIGLAVMGQNLLLNGARKGLTVAGYNRSPKPVESTVERSKLMGVSDKVHATNSPAEFVKFLKTPRRIIALVKADALDAVIDAFKGLLAPGDVFVDGGNSWFEFYQKRYDELAKFGVRFMGMGVSGGEEGALNGPSMMPGGDKEGFEALQPILSVLAAKTFRGPAMSYISAGSSGHYVKMVHNGIEYGIMAIIAEIYHIMRDGLRMSNSEMAAVFQKWNSTPELRSYLAEITGEVLGRTDFMFPGGETTHLVDKLSDVAEGKGTGFWTALETLNNHSVGPVFYTGYEVRLMSQSTELRKAISSIYKTDIVPIPAQEHPRVLEELKAFLLLGTLVAFDQGIQLLRSAAARDNWNLDFPELMRIWSAGCIIRMDLLVVLGNVMSKNPACASIFTADEIVKLVQPYLQPWRSGVARAISLGIPVLTSCSCLQYFDTLRSASLPTNLVMAQRDFFGSHTYERIDGKPGRFHANWRIRGPSYAELLAQSGGSYEKFLQKIADGSLEVSEEWAQDFAQETGQMEILKAHPVLKKFS